MYVYVIPCVYLFMYVCYERVSLRIYVHLITLGLPFRACTSLFLFLWDINHYNTGT